MPEDTIRVVRVYEFSGPRSAVEEQIEHSLKDGTHRWPKFKGMVSREIVVRVATLGDFPEVVYRGLPGSAEYLNHL